MFTGASFPLGPFTPYEGNPILRPRGDSWESANLYNPAALVDGDEVLLLYRAHADDIVSHIGLARSRDGVNFTREDQPILSPAEDYERYGCEDPRIARIDGAGELRILRSIALPLVKPALATVVLVTFIGPWNEFLWPFLITKDASLQPLAVSLANYITNVSQTAANPNGAILAGACALAFPVVALFCLFQRYFRTTDLGSAVKG